MGDLVVQKFSRRQFDQFPFQQLAFAGLIGQSFE